METPTIMVMGDWIDKTKIAELNRKIWGEEWNEKMEWYENPVKSPSSVRRWRRREKRCRSRDAGNRRSNQSRRSLPKSTVRQRATRPVCMEVTATIQHNHFRTAKVRKKCGSQAITKASSKVPAHPAEKRERLLNLKMKENEKIRVFMFFKILIEQ